MKAVGVIFTRITTLAVLGLVAGVGLLFYRHTTQQAAQIAKLQVDNDRMRDALDRLRLERRVAELIVLDETLRDGVPVRTLAFVENGSDGKPLPARQFTVIGRRVHLDTLVIKFDPDLVEAGDARRGHAILLFEKIYGDRQAPADGSPIDVPGSIPAVYSESIIVPDWQRELWKRFWQFSTDETLRQQYKVHAAHGAGVFGPLEVGFKYEITLQPDGNLTLHASKVPAIFSDAMKRSGGR